MKVRIEIDGNLREDEVIIRCSRLDDNIKRLYDIVADAAREVKYPVLYKGNVEYYLPMNDILFFETSDNCICAHTTDDVYNTTYHLYELEEILPRYFMRVSKSTILNINHIYSISRNITSSSLVQFMNTHKQVYVSRNYYKALRLRLEEKRLIK
ncbi:MAG: LytTR family transcriptional regulator [Clostridiales bacterium]|nr:LytTR family transcriptional regulator [Clostridiales bacterium]